MHLKTVRLTVIHNGPKRTISTSDGLEILQMVSELDTELYAREDVGPLKGKIVRSHINWRGEQNICYTGVETSP